MLAAGYGSLVNALKDDGMKPETDIFDGKKVDSPAGLVLNANYEGAIPYLHAALKQILTEIESIKTEAKNMTVEMADIVQHLASHDHQMEALKAENDNLRAANDNEAAQIKALVTRLDALENARRK
jgi:FtsZ-binding cell division protein ZapB